MLFSRRCECKGRAFLRIHQMFICFFLDKNINPSILENQITKIEGLNAFAEQMWGLTSRANGQRIHLDALDHGEQTVGTGGREVFGEADFANEIKIGIKNFFGRKAVDDAEEEADDTFNDEGVAFCTERECAIGIFVANNPYATLAAVDKVRFVLFFGGELATIFAQVNE